MMISVSGLTKTYDTQKALNQVSVDIGKNEVIGLLGPNGAGKSTFMKILVGIISPTIGNVEINGLRVSKDSLETKKTIGYLAENNPLYNEMYVKEYLSFVAKLRSLPKKRITEVIEQVGLERECHKKIAELSKGYKQRVGLAQAIIHRPEVLILDEPTNGLDPNQIVEIRELIREIGRNKTIILSTHIMQEVAALCSRVILLDRGNKIADTPITEFKGEFSDLEQAFKHYTTQTF